MTTTRSKRARRVLEDTSSWGKNHSIASSYTITSFGVPNIIVVSTRFTVPILVSNSKGSRIPASCRIGQSTVATAEATLVFAPDVISNSAHGASLAKSCPIYHHRAMRENTSHNVMLRSLCAR